VGIKDTFFLDRADAVLLVIDVQERLCRAMDAAVLQTLTANTLILLEAAKELGLPVIATEQYVKGLGESLPALKERFPTPALEKISFSCWADPAFAAAVRATGRKQVIVTGMETHVCVLQTVIDLRDSGFTVHLVRDAVMSRHKKNWEAGLGVMAAAGAVVTSTEAALFQLLKVAGTDEFRKLSKLVR
jgi:nicotinamidase-related amidase